MQKNAGIFLLNVDLNAKKISMYLKPEFWVCLRRLEWRKTTTEQPNSHTTTFCPKNQNN